MSAVRIFQLVVVANALLLILQSVRVIAVYSAIFSLTRGKHRQLPKHVWLIATSYLIFTTATAWLLLVQPDPNGFARALLFGVAGLIGQYALWNILQYDRRRLSVASSRAELDDV